MKNTLLGTLALIATQIAPKLIIYAVVISLVVCFVKVRLFEKAGFSRTSFQM